MSTRPTHRKLQGSDETLDSSPIARRTSVREIAGSVNGRREDIGEPGRLGFANSSVS